MTQAHFDQFWRIAMTWPCKSTKRVNLWAIEFHTRVNQDGVDPNEIIRGAEIYTKHHLPNIDWPVAPHTWLRDWCWQAYQDDPAARWRPLRLEEQRAWEVAHRPVPRQAPVDCEFYGPEQQRLRVVNGHAD